MINKELDLSYKQFIIFNISEENPFNDWEQTHIQQGFTYRKNSVGIMTFSETGMLNVVINKSFTENKKAKRILQIPFEIKHNAVEIATVTDSIQCEIKNGFYILSIQGWNLKDNIDHFIISFEETDDLNFKPRYLKYDSEISVFENFNLNATSA